MQRLLPIALILLLAACDSSEPPAEDTPSPEQTAPEATESSGSGTDGADSGTADDQPAPQADDEDGGVDRDRLAAVLDAQSEQIKARYDARNPLETLTFFGLEPGMSVVETLPSSGWYTRILIGYLGADGHLIGANYPFDMWPNFSFASEQFLERMRNWPEQFPEQAKEWCQQDCAPVSTFELGSMPEKMAGKADAVLFIRALHNLARFQNADVDNYLDNALADAYAALKPGGIMGVVQHQARADMPDDWADGSNGYLKKSFVVEKAAAAGFELVAESDINNNPDDQPTTDGYVWRLPPSLRLPEDAEDPEALRERYQAIGESHRMTLKFRKPEADVGGA